MTSCEELGHDVETIYTDDGGVYRHGADRFAWTYLSPGDLDPVAREEFLVRERSFKDWLNYIHVRDVRLADSGGLKAD